MMRAAIVGIAGTALAPAEAELLRATAPAGVILFRRNVQDPSQLNELVAALRAVLPRHAVTMVDQEGGRVARLRPPHWNAHPATASLGRCYDRDPAAGLRAAWLTGALIGLECREAGFDVVTSPVLDLSIPGAHDVIGDRALAQDPEVIARLGRCMAAGLLAAGIQPVGKHAPGHGRAQVDSHHALPRVEANHLEADLLPFVLNADLPWLMTAHIVYPTLDKLLPATLSPTIIETVIRKTIGFDGVLVTDDLAMHALSGRPADLALQALSAGCDIALYCAGDFEPTRALLMECPMLTGLADARFRRARLSAQWHRSALKPAALRAERDLLLA
jgi:beta-N-acetylhexosaminidase